VLCTSDASTAPGARCGTIDSIVLRTGHEPDPTLTFAQGCICRTPAAVERTFRVGGAFASEREHPSPSSAPLDAAGVDSGHSTYGTAPAFAYCTERAPLVELGRSLAVLHRSPKRLEKLVRPASD